MIGLGVLHFLFTVASATTFCSEYASPRAADTEFGAGWNQPTRTLVAFYRELLQRGNLGDEDLLKMRDGLVQGKRVSPFPRAGNTNIENTQFAGVVNNLFTPELSTENVLLWIDGELRARVNERDRSRAQQKETRLPTRNMKWIWVGPGTFEWDNISTILSNPFLVSDALITQAQWIDVMGENPYIIAEGEETVEIAIRRSGLGVIKYVRGQPDYPIQNITWYAAAEFANRMSIRDGLPPVFDFSGLNQVPNTRAEDGTLDFTGGQIGINAPEGNIYKAKGYRFLTEGERDALFRKADVDKLTESEFLDRAWVTENSDSKSHEVATRVPFNVDGSDIFDLLGNASEWLFDGGAGEYQGGTNPQRLPYCGEQRMTFGGDRTIGVAMCRIGLRFKMSAISSGVGFRLARTAE